MRSSILLFLLFTSLRLSAQLFYSEKYIGFNANPILAQVIPLNNINPELSMASLMFRSYNHRDNGFRSAFGVSLGTDNDQRTLYLGFDLDFRRPLAYRWRYFQGLGSTIFVKSDRIGRNLNSPNNNEVKFSVGWHWGVEYLITSVFSISTEATLNLGVDLESEQGFLKIDPPVNIIAHFYLSNEN